MTRCMILNLVMYLKGEGVWLGFGCLGMISGRYPIKMGFYFTMLNNKCTNNTSYRLINH